LIAEEVRNILFQTGFNHLGSKWNQIGIIEQTSPNKKPKKRWKRCEVADFAYCGNNQLLILMSKGILSRWKFSKLEIAECTSRLDLKLLASEMTYSIKIGRDYNHACIDAFYQYKNRKPFSSRIFMINLRGSSDIFSLDPEGSVVKKDSRNGELVAQKVS
jgi:hypothetical protein